MPSPIKALFFDWNGTCSDIRHVDREAWSAAWRANRGKSYRSMSEVIGGELAAQLAGATPWPDLAGLVGVVQPLVVLTNNDHHMMKIIMGLESVVAAGFHFHSADDSQCFKPAERMYRDAMVDWCVKPSESLMVAAHNFDLAAAKALGMKTCFVTRPGEDVSDGGWDYEVSDFYQLAEIVNAQVE